MLTGHEKAAVVLSLLGDELSQKILGFLPEESAVSIISASEKLKTPSKDALLDLVSEFNDHLSRAPVPTKQESQEVPAAMAMPGSPLDIIARASAPEIAKALSLERPEVSAYVLSHLPVEKIYEVMTMLKEGRETIESRLMNIKDVPIAKELQDKILKTISERLI